MSFVLYFSDKTSISDDVLTSKAVEDDEAAVGESVWAVVGEPVEAIVDEPVLSRYLTFSVI